MEHLEDAEIGRLTILLIEDDEGDRMHVTRCLRHSGLDCVVLEHDDIDPGFSAHADIPIDLVLLDYNLPGGDSLSNLHHLRRQWPDCSFVLTTGEGTDLLVAKAFRAGVCDYISKMDISARSIRRVIENAVRAKRLALRVAAQTEELKMFAHVLAHDVKAPLRAIRQLGEWARENLAEGETEAAQEDVGDVVLTAARLDGLVDSLQAHLDVRGAPSIAPEDAAALAREAVENLRLEIRDRGAEVHIDDLPVIACDRRQMIQLFQNLIANGLKFSWADAPRIKITAPLTAPGVHTICVADNGIGVSPEHAERIFEPFQRLHTQEDFSGSGLGLATCRKIVTRHGGRIWCDSRPNEGARFNFSLPATEDTEIRRAGAL